MRPNEQNKISNGASDSYLSVEKTGSSFRGKKLGQKILSKLDKFGLLLIWRFSSFHL